jgi:AraC-like DNA-binding protein
MLVAPGVVLDPALKAAGDSAVFWRVPRLGLDCLRARFRRHAYARHTHETYALAAILDGCETFFHRGRQHYATPGAIALVGPDELHDGAPHDERGFVYRTLYPSVDLMREVAEEISGKPVLHPPRFRESVVHDPELAALLAEAHRTLERPHEPLLARDARVVSLLSLLIVRYTDAGAELPARPERGPVAHARAYLDARFSEDVDLLDLVRIAGLSRTHLIRAFRRETGLTPHAYLLDRRFRAASRALGRGEAPAAVALRCGFCDQSHLNRVFKARMGVTPGAYRAA